MLLRTIALTSLILLTACDKPAPADAAAAPPAKAAKPPGSLPTKRLPPDDPHAAPPPGETTEVPLLSAPGTFDVTVEGRLSHYARIPRGQNRALVIPDKKVARVSIAGALSDDGWPNVRIILENFRPDEAKYPVTLSSTAKKGPRASVRYYLSEKQVYRVDHEKNAKAEVTLEAYEGKTLRGSFTSTLAPTAAGLGKPLPVSGKFSVELVLSGVEPGPTPAEGAPPKGDPAPAKRDPAPAKRDPAPAKRDPAKADANVKK
ncbi:MAG: hypothetical protein AAGF11_29015 [Myxococcota bacterium]